MLTLIKYKYNFLTSKLLFPLKNTKEYVFFLIKNRISLQHEFDDLERLYEKKKLDPKTREWFVEVCQMLEKYHEKNPLNVKKYKEQRQKLLEENVDALPKKCSDDFTLETARSKIGDANMLRLNSRFAMITVGAALQNNSLMQILERITQQHVNTTILVAPIDMYNALSVGFFGLRFVVNTIDIIQNLINASTEEKQLSWWYRLYVELDKHEYQLGNDIVWGVVNFFTNFPRYLHLSGPVSNYVMAVFLVFDIVWMANLLRKSTARFSEQRKDNDWLKEQLNKETNSESYAGVIQDIDDQMIELNYRQENLTWKLLFFIAAGLLLIAGFSAAIVFSPPVLVPLCFLVCNIGIAMYFSGGLAGSVMEKRLIRNASEDPTDAQKDLNDAWQKLGAAMLEYTFVPIIILGVCTISWPAAVVLTAIYIAIKLGVVESARKELPASAMFAKKGESTLTEPAGNECTAAPVN